MDLDYAKEFWTLANIIAGFAVVNSLTFLITVGPHRSDLAQAVAANRRLTFIGTIVGMGIYAGLIEFCQIAEWNLMRSQHVSEQIWHYVWWWDVVRVVAAVLAAAMCAFIVYSTKLEKEE